MPEYLVRPALRYVVTEFKEGVSRPLGEYDNQSLAWTVASGIAKANGGFAAIPCKDYRELGESLVTDYASPVDVPVG